MPRGRAISVLSLGVWWAKLEKNDKVRHIVIQIASLLAVATVFIDLWTPLYSQGGAYTRDKTTQRRLDIVLYIMKEFLELGNETSLVSLC